MVTVECDVDIVCENIFSGLINVFYIFSEDFFYFYIFSEDFFFYKKGYPVLDNTLVKLKDHSAVINSIGCVGHSSWQVEKKY